nr:PREDICTED: uncharacterized protein LOC105677354 [Linepithema humile]
MNLENPRNLDFHINFSSDEEGVEDAIRRAPKRYLRDFQNPFEFYSEIEFKRRFRFSKNSVLFGIFPLIEQGLAKINNRASLESARQDAANYQTTEKRKRQHFPCNRYSSEKEEDETSSQTAANIMLKDVNQRLTKIETALKNHSQKSFNVVENTLIAKFLPLTTIENIKEFDVLLKTTDEAVTQFKEFISKIGGNNSRDNIHRTLRKIFTNECAMNCSWKGLRNNFRIVDLYITKLIKREIISCYINLTESEYNIIHRRTRIIVERTFGMWKRRFPCLSKGLTTKLSTSTTIIVACAVLHNLSLIFNDKLDDDDDDEELENANNEVSEIQPHWQPGDGFLVRNALIERLFR